jgi:hypothetical protein
MKTDNRKEQRLYRTLRNGPVPRRGIRMRKPAKEFPDGSVTKSDPTQAVSHEEVQRMTEEDEDFAQSNAGKSEKRGIDAARRIHGNPLEPDASSIRR